MEEKKLTFRIYEDGDDSHVPWSEFIFEQDTTYKCPTYVNRTPPCQGSCPSGEDIRGWLNIVRGIEKPAEGDTWQEYAFRRSTDANPFPSIMGRVCPAPCQDGCNRNDVEDFVGINAVEQFIGDTALTEGYTFSTNAKETGKKVAIIGGGPGGLAAAYQLRRKGHAATIFDNHAELGGMMRYGIPGYRTPRNVLDGEIKRIIDMGVEVNTNTWIGKDIDLEDLERDYDAVLFANGAQQGRDLPIDGFADAPNCITGVAFLEAFNEGRLQASANKVVVVGGGDTAIDVVSVARRLGHIKNLNESDRVENVVLGYVAHDVAMAAKREGAQVTMAYRRPIDKMPAAQHEIDTAYQEGVEIITSVVPLSVVVSENGRATALRLAKATWEGNTMTMVEGSEFDIEADLIVAAIGQTGNMEGLESVANDRGLIDADKYYQIPGKKGYFVCGDVVRPHLLTTAIGQASVVVETIEHYFSELENNNRPKVDVHHFDLLEKLRESGLEPEAFGHHQEWGTDEADFAVHNYEDRSANEVIPVDQLYLGHFPYVSRNKRAEIDVNAEEVLGHFKERIIGFEEQKAKDEADRCMSCGMCFECDNCVIYCPQDAVLRTPKKDATTGRYVYTDYNKCIGCHICAEVCPTGYIDMGMGV